MSRLKPGDEDLHYEDGSHRWAGGSGSPQDVERWRAKVEAHKQAHRSAASSANATWWPGRLQQRVVRARGNPSK